MYKEGDLPIADITVWPTYRSVEGLLKGINKLYKEGMDKLDEAKFMRELGAGDNADLQLLHFIDREISTLCYLTKCMYQANYKREPDLVWDDACESLLASCEVKDGKIYVTVPKLPFSCHNPNYNRVDYIIGSNAAMAIKNYERINGVRLHDAIKPPLQVTMLRVYDKESRQICDVGNLIMARTFNAIINEIGYSDNPGVLKKRIDTFEIDPKGTERTVFIIENISE